MMDATSWRSLCEKAKYARSDAEGSGIFAIVCDTIDLAAHCGTHPVGIIHFARTSFGLKTWDMDSVEFLKDNLLDQEDEDQPPSDHDDDETDLDGQMGGECPPAPKKRKQFGLREAIVD